MHPEEIKAKIRMQGVTGAQIADDLGVSRTAVSSVIAGRSTSNRIANYISNLVGIPTDKLWPPQPKLRRNRPYAQPSSRIGQGA